MNGRNLGNVHNLEDLKRVANEALSFAGGEEDMYTGEDFYTGGEGLVQFVGDPAGKDGRIFQFVITNANAAVRTALLCGGLYKTSALPAGLMATGAFNDVNGAAGLTGQGITDTIERFLIYTKENPSLINVMQVQSDQEAQLNYAAVYAQDSPFETLKSRNIPFSAYQTTQDTKKMVIVPLNNFDVQFDNQTIFKVPFAPNSTTTITLYVGGDANTARALNVATRNAKKGIVKPSKKA